jgi:hypothetical protein
VLVGGVPVVARASSIEVAERIADRLAPWRVEHPGINAGISLKASAHEDGRRTAHSVYRHGFFVRSTYSLDDALQTVEALLHTFVPAPADVTPMHVRALELNGSVLLVSESFTETVDGHHRRLARAGVRVWPHAPVFVDGARAQALLPDGAPGEGAWRRIPVAQVVAFAPTGDEDVSPAVRITHFTPLVAGRDAPTQGADVQALVALKEVVPFVGLDVVAPHSVIGALLELATSDAVSRR